MEQYLSKAQASLSSKTDWSLFLEPREIELFLRDSEKMHRYYYILEQEYLDQEKAKTLTKTAPNQLLANLLLKATEMQTLRPHAI